MNKQKERQVIYSIGLAKHFNTYKIFCQPIFLIFPQLY